MNVQYQTWVGWSFQNISMLCLPLMSNAFGVDASNLLFPTRNNLLQSHHPVHLPGPCVIAVRIIRGGPMRIMAIATMALIMVSQFAGELGSIGSPTIWFPFGIGVTLTQYAYAIAIPLLALLIVSFRGPTARCNGRSRKQALKPSAFPWGDVGNYWDWRKGTVYPLGKASQTQDTLNALFDLTHATGRMTNQYRSKVMSHTSAAMQKAYLVTSPRLITMAPTFAINGLYGATEDAYDSPYA